MKILVGLFTILSFSLSFAKGETPMENRIKNLFPSGDYVLLETESSVRGSHRFICPESDYFQWRKLGRSLGFVLSPRVIPYFQPHLLNKDKTPDPTNPSDTGNSDCFTHYQYRFDESKKELKVLTEINCKKGDNITDVQEVLRREGDRIVFHEINKVIIDKKPDEHNEIYCVYKKKN